MLVSITQLLSTCVYANLEACEIIRNYHYDWCKNQSKINDSNDVTLSNHQLKIEGDPRSVVTQADIDAQCKIVDILRQQIPWGDSIRIVGEEDTGDDNDGKSENEDEDDQINLTRNDSIMTDFFQELTKEQKLSSDEEDKVPIDELTVFIDPLDGTREFVEKRIENVGCLIGITRNGKAIAGTVGVPFPSANSKDENPYLYYALLSSKMEEDHIHGTWPLDENINSEKNQLKVGDNNVDLTIFTGDSKSTMLANAVNHMKNIASSSTVKHKVLGGSAAKLRSVATINDSLSSIAILHSATYVWDTVATEALVHATGGRVTDFLGNPLATHSSYSSDVQNIHGVIASSKKASKFHDELCKKIQQDVDFVSQIMREK